MERDRVAREAGDHAEEDVAWLVNLGVLDEPLAASALDEAFDEAESEWGVVGNLDRQRTVYVRGVLRYCDRAMLFSYDSIHGYSGYEDLIEKYRRIADGRLDDLEYDVDGNWADREDPVLTLRLGDETITRTLRHVGDAVDPEFYGLLDDVLARTDAERSFAWLVDDTVSLVGLVTDCRAAAIRVYLEDPEKQLPPAAVADEGALVDHLSHDDPTVRRTAAAVVADIGLVEAVPSLEARLAADPEPAVKVACVDAIASLGGTDDAVRSAVRELLIADDAAVRRRTFELLADEDAARGNTFVPEDDETVRRRVAAALDDPDPEVRRLAFEGATATWAGYRRELLPEDDETVRDRIRAALRSADPALQDAAAALASRYEMDPDPDLLLEILGGTDGQGYENVIEALGETRAESATPALVSLLNESTDASVRTSAASALGDVFTTEARAALARTLDDPDTEIREAAYDALARFSDQLELVPPPESVDGVPAIVDQEFEVEELEHVPSRAVDAVGHLDTSAAVDRLIEATEADDEYVREKAAAWLSERPVEAATPALIALVENREDERELAVESAIAGLYRSEDPRAEEFVGFVRDHDELEIPWHADRSDGRLPEPGEGVLGRIRSIVGFLFAVAVTVFLLALLPVLILGNVIWGLLTERSLDPVVQEIDTISEDPRYATTGLVLWALVIWYLTSGP